MHAHINKLQKVTELCKQFKFQKHSFPRSWHLFKLDPALTILYLSKIALMLTLLHFIVDYLYF